jgi:hypothetical protein
MRRIEGAQVHFNLVIATSVNGRAAARTEKAAGVVACFAIDRHRIPREYRGSVKERAMMLATVETVTNADAIRPPRRLDSHVAAQATTREPVHAASPMKSRGQNIYNEPIVIAIARARMAVASVNPHAGNIATDSAITSSGRSAEVASCRNFSKNT